MANQEPLFFATAEAFREWLLANHTSVPELTIGYHKKGSGYPSITYPESVDEALCFGWIDGVRRSIDAGRYTGRFTPRRKGSIWSAVNVKRMSELIEAGRVHAAGMAAWAARDPDKTNMYSFEQRQAVFADGLEAQFRANDAAWAYFEAQPPSYRRMATYWVISAKQETTRQRRLETLIEDSAAGRRIAASLPRRQDRVR